MASRLSKPSLNPGNTTTGTENAEWYDGVPIESQTHAYAIDAAWQRDKAWIDHTDSKQNHELRRDDDWEARSTAKVRLSTASLLNELAVDRGMSWSDIANLVGVTVAAVRKWRTGGDSNADRRLALARLSAFLDVLEKHCAIEDPAQWLEVPLSLGREYVVRPIDLYKEDHASSVLEIASQRRSAQAVLDEIDPDWRTTRRREFETYDASDGQKAIRAIRQ
jgi:transcriptional regulator with XRE-family HTH domain